MTRFSLSRRQQAAPLVAAVALARSGIELQPTPGDLLVVPTGHPLRQSPDDHVEVVRHHRTGADLDAEEPRNFLDAVVHPSAAVLVIATREEVLAAEKGAAHTA